MNLSGRINEPFLTMAKIQGGCGKDQGNGVVKVLWELREEEMTLDCRNHGGGGIVFELAVWQGFGQRDGARTFELKGIM